MFRHLAGFEQDLVEHCWWQAVLKNRALCRERYETTGRRRYEAKKAADPEAVKATAKRAYERWKAKHSGTPEQRAKEAAKQRRLRAERKAAT